MRIVLVPDTQTYTEKYPEILRTQIQWIADNARETDLVIQQGDLTQNNSKEEWETVRQAFRKLDGKVPYVLAVGNHDMGSAPGKFADTRNTTLFNRYFPYSEMSGLPGFGGSFEPDTMDNAWYTVKTGKIKWLVLSLEFGPRNKVLAWAGKIIEEHPDHLVIVNTHSYMYADNTRQGEGDDWRPQVYGIGKDTGEDAVNDGEDIWQKLIKRYPNVRFVFSGHVLHSGVGTLVSINDGGYPVYQMLANYQEGVKGAEKGGNGWLRILDMDLRENSIEVNTYSPYLGKHMEDPAHHFRIQNAFFEPAEQ
ncbi:metallophosphoesterase [Sinomicrobium weinanense]|nr:metallophosphoesterase [Sinomicrobium weinanense]